MLEDRVRELENMIAEAQALREDGSQQANRKQGGGDGGLPRPDIALISTPIGTEPSGDPPAEITEHLSVFRLASSLGTTELRDAINSGYKRSSNIYISSILVST